jgi:hypothetical protein
VHENKLSGLPAGLRQLFWTRHLPASIHLGVKALRLATKGRPVDRLMIQITNACP